MLLLQSLHLVEGGRDLVTLHKRVELLEVANEIGTAELDLLAGAAGTEGVGVDRHARKASKGGENAESNLDRMYQRH